MSSGLTRHQPGSGEYMPAAYLLVLWSWRGLAATSQAPRSYWVHGSPRSHDQPATAPVGATTVETGEECRRHGVGVQLVLPPVGACANVAKMTVEAGPVSHPRSPQWHRRPCRSRRSCPRAGTAAKIVPTSPTTPTDPPVLPCAALRRRKRDRLGDIPQCRHRGDQIVEGSVAVCQHQPLVACDAILARDVAPLT